LFVAVAEPDSLDDVRLGSEADVTGRPSRAPLGATNGNLRTPPDDQDLVALLATLAGDHVIWRFVC
jgi:hypothetical protein